MKKTLLFLVLAAGIASSKADTYNIGAENSFYLGFYADDAVSTRSVIVNLGNSTNVFAGISLDQSGLASVLATTYGANWYNNSDVRWGAFGYNGAYGNGGNAFVGRNSSLSNLITGPGGRTSLNEEQYYTFLDYASALFAAHNNAGADKSYVTGSTGHQHQFSVVDNSSTSFSGIADDAWTIFSSAVYAPVTSNLKVTEYNGTTFGTVGSGPAAAASIESTGGVVSVVPEPSTYALIGIAALLFVVAYRRKTA
jgi:hypothetical protein